MSHIAALTEVLRRAQAEAVDGVVAFILSKGLVDESVLAAVIDEYKTAVAAPKKRKFTPNGYSLFSKEHRSAIVVANPGVRTTEIMKLIAAAWKGLADAEKATFKERAKAASVQATQAAASVHVEASVQAADSV
jgi:hypothetical protein